MALFGRNQEAKNHQQLELEHEQIEAIVGKYVVRLFSYFTSGKYGILNMYEGIANFANRHNLTIVNIAKPEDGFMRDGVTVIFEKENYLKNHYPFSSSNGNGNGW